MEPFLGEIRMFGFNFPPRGWLLCNGELLMIEQYQSLYTILGPTYGGDGRSTFALPDLRGRTPINHNNTVELGQRGGEETVTLTADTIPHHTHAVQASIWSANSTDFEDNILSVAAIKAYSAMNPDSFMNASAIPTVGGGQEHENMPPFLAINYCICIDGYYPPPH